MLTAHEADAQPLRAAVGPLWLQLVHHVGDEAPRARVVDVAPRPVDQFADDVGASGRAAEQDVDLLGHVPGPNDGQAVGATRT